MENIKNIINENDWSSALYHNKAKLWHQLFNQIDKVITKIADGCFPRLSK